MSDIFKRVKSIFTNIKSFISSNEEKKKDPYDKLIDRFSFNKPVEVNELEELKTLIQQITEEEAIENINVKFGILRDLMFEKVVDATCKSKIIVEDKKVRNKKEYKEFIKREYERMSNNELEEEKKEVKRVKTNTHDFKNEVSWGILPDKWRHVRENSPIDIVEFALHNDDEAKGPVLFLGDVPGDLEESYFNEDYVSNLFEKSKSSGIVCDLYNPESNCRKCIRYEFNQEKLKRVLEEQYQNKLKEEELYDTIKGKCGLQTECSEKFIQKTNNIEDKVWLSFLFNNNFKFSELSDIEKDFFFGKLKKSGVLCMDALDKKEDNIVNKKTIDAALKRELFDIKENIGGVLQDSVLKTNEDKHVKFLINENHEKKENKFEDKLKTKIEVPLISPFNINKDQNLENNIEIHSEGKEASTINIPKFDIFKNNTTPVIETPLKEKETLTFPLPPFDIKSTINQPSDTKTVSQNQTEKNVNDIKIPEDWHFSQPYPPEIKKDESINPIKPTETHPPVFNKISEKNQAVPPFKMDKIVVPPLNIPPVESFKPVNTDFSILNIPNSSFSFTPSTNLSSIPTSTPIPSSPTTPQFVSPFKRKIEPKNLFQNKFDQFTFTPLDSNMNNQISQPLSFGQTPIINSNVEHNKISGMQQNNTPFLGEVPNPFETANPLQHTRNENLKFVDNTFKYNDIFNKTNNNNIFANTKSMFDDLIFEGDKNEEQSSTVRYLNPDNDNKGNGSNNFFGGNLFGNDTDPWNK